MSTYKIGEEVEVNIRGLPNFSQSKLYPVEDWRPGVILDYPRSDFYTVSVELDSGNLTYVVSDVLIRKPEPKSKTLNPDLKTVADTLDAEIRRMEQRLADLRAARDLILKLEQV